MPVFTVVHINTEGRYEDRDFLGDLEVALNILFGSQAKWFDSPVFIKDAEDCGYILMREGGEYPGEYYLRKGQHSLLGADEVSEVTWTGRVWKVDNYRDLLTVTVCPVTSFDWDESRKHLLV